MGDHERIGQVCVKVYKKFAETDSDVNDNAWAHN
jgi:hypothetical protein